ncbi:MULTISPECIES: hypothetical protein [Brevibacillus]|nr:MULTISPECIES: hypothetical protein [Brevibacillus]MED1948617.1 hypothetical protein [Brevibacillus formosus]MED2001662.1 hypothetical protein [Brevibacillus formosus]MED2085280.1 hypothetical protein [Brevibacillus formosus]
MESLQHPCRSIVSKTRESKQIEKLEWEVWRNLEAKVADLVADVGEGEVIAK